MEISKSFEFAMAHRLPYHPKCRNVHGHNIKFEVFIEGKTQSNGMVLDFAELDRIVKEEIVSEWDHAWLFNVRDEPTKEALEILKQHFPVKAVGFPWHITSENLAKYIYDRLRAAHLNVSKVVLWESSSSKVVYKG